MYVHSREQVANNPLNKKFGLQKCLYITNHISTHS